MLDMATEKKTAGHVHWDSIRRSTAEQVEDQRRWARLVLGGATLADLRELVGRTQLQVAEAVGVSQVEAGRAERRVDLQLSTLRRYLDALGFDLEMHARSREHPDRLVPLNTPGEPIVMTVGRRRVEVTRGEALAASSPEGRRKLAKRLRGKAGN